MINKVKGYRVMANMTQKDMAEKMGISLRTYLAKEYGEADFSSNELLKLKNILNEKGLKVGDRPLILDDLI